MTPSPAYPVTPRLYAAGFGVANDADFPAAADVLFTGSEGSGLTRAPAWQAWGGDRWRFYQSSPVFQPAAPPGGAWVVAYKGSNVTFTVPEPRAAARLVIPLPTVRVTDGLLRSVNWVYTDAATVASLDTVPAFLTGIQVQIGGTDGGRL